MENKRLSLYNTPTTSICVLFSKIKQVGVFFMSRVYDVATTLLNIYAYGYSPDTEANPIQRHLLGLGVGYFISFQLLATLLAILLVRMHRWHAQIFKALTIISLLVGTSNLITYLVVRYWQLL